MQQTLEYKTKDVTKIQVGQNLLRQLVHVHKSLHPPKKIQTLCDTSVMLIVLMSNADTC